MWLARVRSFIARHRATYWVAVAGLALTVALVLMSQSRQLNEARDEWGSSVDVWVAAADTAPGDPLLVDRRAMPAAMLPRAAVTGAWPVGATARQTVVAGEVVVAADIGTGRLPLLPSEWRAVAVTAGDTTIPLVIGDHVDVVANGAVLSIDAVVVDMQASVAVIGVPADDAPGVAVASRDGTAVVVVRPG